MKMELGEDIVNCPECGLPSVVEDSRELPSTSGLIEHIKIQCVKRHQFNAARDTLMKRESNVTYT